MIKYQVTKEFVKGNLKGLCITEMTSVKFQVGKTYTACVGNCAYKVTQCSVVI